MPELKPWPMDRRRWGVVPMKLLISPQDKHAGIAGGTGLPFINERLIALSYVGWLWNAGAAPWTCSATSIPDDQLYLPSKRQLWIHREHHEAHSPAAQGIGILATGSSPRIILPIDGVHSSKVRSPISPSTMINALQDGVQCCYGPEGECVKSPFSRSGYIL